MWEMVEIHWRHSSWEGTLGVAVVVFVIIIVKWFHFSSMHGHVFISIAFLTSMHHHLCYIFYFCIIDQLQWSFVFSLFLYLKGHLWIFIKKAICIQVIILSRWEFQTSRDFRPSIICQSLCATVLDIPNAKVRCQAFGWAFGAHASFSLQFFY